MPEIIGHEMRIEFDSVITAPEVAHKFLREVKNLIISEYDEVDGITILIRPILGEVEFIEL